MDVFTKGREDGWILFVSVNDQCAGAIQNKLAEVANLYDTDMEYVRVDGKGFAVCTSSDHRLALIAGVLDQWLDRERICIRESHFPGRPLGETRLLTAQHLSWLPYGFYNHPKEKDPFEIRFGSYRDMRAEEYAVYENKISKQERVNVEMSKLASRLKGLFLSPNHTLQLAR